jgi:GTP-binding protein LepA
MENSKIRNFVIIAHIDHGKSTLADRFLEITKTIELGKMHPQYLDRMDLEKERQITIKLAPVRMEYKGYILNLIDTPGHVDFSYEVSRSLAACEGAILLVDAAQGIQAQTLAVLELAQKENLSIIPVINKIDLPQAETEKRVEELSNLLKINQDEILKVSAKTGQGVEELLNKIIAKIPEPVGDKDKPLKALIFDSIYDSYKGVIAYVRIFEGAVKKDDRVEFIETKTIGKATQVGVFKPQYLEIEKLSAGEVGYIVTNIKEIEKCQVGDTITLSPLAKNFEKLIGYKQPQSNIFVSIFSLKGESEKLKNALTQLQLNDSSLEFKPELSPVLGAGFRLGLLGMLHLEIIRERLEREYDLDLVLSAPSVSYNVVKKNGEKLVINNPNQFPDPSEIQEILQPIMKVEIIIPNQYFGSISELLKNKRGKFLETKILEENKTLLVYEIPLSQIVWGFYDDLKSLTSGLGSFNYQFLDYLPADLEKLEILIANEPFPAFSQIIYKDDIYSKGREIVLKLKNLIPKQMFEVSIQAVVGAKVIARENISALRKDVIAKLYGGDYTRKSKLLKKQKKGKKRMKDSGRVNIPKEVFWKMLK